MTLETPNYQEIVNSILEDKRAHMKRVHSNYPHHKPQWQRSESNFNSAELWERASEFHDWLWDETNSDVRHSNQRNKAAADDFQVKNALTIKKILDYCEKTDPSQDVVYQEWLRIRSEGKGEAQYELQKNSTEPNTEA